MMGKAWMIASGKGGAGKSTIAAALATALSQQKERVCIIDVDIGLRDQDLILGVENRIVYDLLDVLSGDCTLEEALVSPAPFHRLSLLPAAQFARSRDLDPKAFRQTLRTLKRKFDHVLIDCPAGIERGFRTVMANEYDSVILICTPDDVCIRNAERTVSLLDEQKMPRPQLIVNRLHANLIASGEMYAAQTVAQTLDLPLLGEVPDDMALYRALLTHKNPMQLDCEAQRALSRIAQRMRGVSVPFPAYGARKAGLFRKLLTRRVKEVRAD